jgi:hypothetical protein
MFICSVSIDILDDDIYYKLNLGFYENDLCNVVVDSINKGKYNANFAKNCVIAENISYLDKENSFPYTIFLNENDAIEFIENFFIDYEKGDDFLSKNYKMEVKYFVQEVYSDEDYSDYSDY